jgi:hypothetical protein
VRYARFDAEMTPMGRSRAYVRARGGTVARVLELAELRVLMACAEPRPLREHADECRRTLPAALLAALPAPPEVPAGARDGAALDACLEGLVADGLLRPERDVAAFLRARLPEELEPAPYPGIGALCVPTRDRPEVLRRALRSYLDNCARHGRAPEVVVLDDSETAAMRDRNLAVLREAGARHGAPVRRATPARRESFARELAALAGVPEDAARFALLGDPRFPTRYGATRNALLLDTVGELCLQVDDDTVCAVSRPPGARHELLLSPEADPNEYWFGAGAARCGQAADEDFLGLHERVLGRSTAECVALGESGPVRIAAPWSAEHLARVTEGGARVAVSFAGIAGDCGGPGRHHARLELRGPSLERLVGGEDGFRDRLHSRELLKCATRTVVGTGPYCMAGNMGLDNRGLLPPFVPVGIAEDALFGGLRSALFPGLLGASIPYAIVHEPVPARPARVGGAPLTIYANGVLSMLVAGFCGVWPGAGAPAMAALGGYLRELGTLPGDGFAARVRHATAELAGGAVGQLEALLASRRDAPPHWRQAAGEYLDEAASLLLREDAASPSDLPGTPSERRALFQLLLRRYGEVLEHWPALVEAAAGLRRRGVRLSEAV